MKKKVIWFWLISICLLLTACGKKNDAVAERVDTIGNNLAVVFEKAVEKNASASAQELADAVLASELIPFAGASMPVEEGLLTGFGNVEITGFDEGVMFAPMIGSIPFVGYVFVLPDGADAESFMTTLKTNADPRWNICTQADETIVENSGNKIFFLMCPATFEEGNS